MKTTILFLFLITSIIHPVQEEVYIEGDRKAKISTEFGDMVIRLYDDTPLHKANFIRNVESGLYNNTLFHRVIPYFMMQGGDPNSIGAPMEKGLGVDSCPQVEAEIRPRYFHKKGALAAARLPDNMNPSRASSGCQFFVVQGYKHNDSQLLNSGKNLTPMQKAWYKVRGGYPFLDNDYTIFGEVVEGLEVIDLIGNMETHQAGANKDRPLEDIKMTVTMLN